MASTHMVGLPYKFTNSSRRELEDAFLSYRNGMATFQPSSTSSFAIISDTTTLEAFLQFLKNFIRRERDREPEILEAPKIYRVPGTQAATGTSDLVTRNTKISACLNSNEQLIVYEADSLTWVPTRLDGRPYRPSEQILARIAKLTNCIIEPDEVSRGFRVRGDTDEHIHEAIKKLEVVDASETVVLPVIYNHLCDESEIEYTIALKPLQDLLDGRLRTTTLPSSSSGQKSIGSAMVTVLINRKGEIVQSQEQTPISLHPRLWQKHTINSFGRSQSVGLTPPIDVDSTKSNIHEDPIESWLTKTSTPSESPFDSFSSTTSLTHGKNQAEQPVQTSSFERTTRRIRKVRNSIPEGSNPTDASAHCTVVRKPESFGCGETPPGVDMLLSQQYPNEAFAQHKHEKGRMQAVADPHHVNASKILSLLEQLDGQKISPPTELEQIPPTFTLTETNSITTPSIVEPPKIAPPVMPPTSVTSQISESATTWESSIVSGGRSTSHDLLAFVSPVVSKTSSQSKPNNKQRKQHCTMKQQAIASTAGKAAILKEYEAQICRVLAMVRSRPGKVRLKVDIGRILLDAETIPRQYVKQPFSQCVWESAFRASDGNATIQASFCNHLTTVACEAESLITIKLRRGRSLFIAEPEQQRVTYEIRCTTEQNEKILIEVGEDGTWEIQAQELLAGALHWHYPKRMWDSRLSVTACQFLGLNYVSAAQSIAAGFKIAPSASGRDLDVFVQNPNPDFRIDSLMLRRMTTHTSAVYPDLAIHLSQVQVINLQPLEGKPCIYTGSISTEQKMAAKGRLWWEASLSSLKAASVLHENEGLELGCTANWKPEDVIDNGVVGDLSSLAHDIVTRIGAVGLRYEGSTAARSKKTTLQTSESPLELLNGLSRW